MAVQTTGVVLKDDPDGALRIEFRTALNAEEVKAFLQANMGQEVEIVLTSKAERPLAGEVTATTEGKELDKRNLSPCASAHYWQDKDKKHL